MDDFSAYANMVASAAAQNNAWSAEQAQKQMDFQERMSSTAHQREVADLKAAGLNPVLSARLGGASTPSGAMGSTDTSLTSSLVELLELSMETANSAASAAKGAVSSLPEDNSAKEFGTNSDGTPILTVDDMPENTKKFLGYFGSGVMNFFAGNFGKAKSDMVNAAKCVPGAFNDYGEVSQKKFPSYVAQASSYKNYFDPVTGSWVPEGGYSKHHTRGSF